MIVKVYDLKGNEHEKESVDARECVAEMGWSLMPPVPKETKAEAKARAKAEAEAAEAEEKAKAEAEENTNAGNE
jgi:membrane protein involved in colicin uptake